MGNTVCLMDQYILEIRRIYEKKTKETGSERAENSRFYQVQSIEHRRSTITTQEIYQEINNKNLSSLRFLKDFL